MKKIALEEHFIAPGFEEYCEPTVADLDRTVYSEVFTRLRDFGDLRLEGMDKAGIERSVLSVTTPGVQIERDPTVACRSLNLTFVLTHAWLFLARILSRLRWSMRAPPFGCHRHAGVPARRDASRTCTGTGRR